MEEMINENQEYQALKAYLDKILPGLLDFLINVIIAIVILLIGLKLINMLVNTIKKSLNKSRVEQGVATFLASFVRYMLYFVLGMTILARFGVTTSSVVAVLGSAGLTLGLALQGSLSNFAGGILILILKPFVVGDYIVENSGKQEGTVAEITIFYTKILTTDNKAIWIPNGTLSNTSIVNASAMDKRRLDLLVEVAYDSDLDIFNCIFCTLNITCKEVSDNTVFHTAKETDYCIVRIYFLKACIFCHHSCCCTNKVGNFVLFVHYVVNIFFSAC